MVYRFKKVKKERKRKKAEDQNRKQKEQKKGKGCMVVFLTINSGREAQARSSLHYLGNYFSGSSFITCTLCDSYGSTGHLT